MANFVAKPRTKSDKYAASGAEMEKLLDIENKLMFQVEQKLSQAQPNSIIQNHIDSLHHVMSKIENERNLSKILSFVKNALFLVHINLADPLSILYAAYKTELKKCSTEFKSNFSIENPMEQ